MFKIEGKHKKKAVKQKGQQIEKKPEVIDDLVKTAEEKTAEEKPPPKPEEVSEVVEEVREEINGKKKEKKEEAKSPDYTSKGKDYVAYSQAESHPEEKLAHSSDDLAVDDDFALHKLRKDTDPLEYIKKGKYNKPWDNPFLCYVRDGINDRAKRVSVLARKGFNSTIHGIYAVYHSIYGWVYRKK